MALASELNSIYQILLKMLGMINIFSFPLHISIFHEKWPWLNVKSNIFSFNFNAGVGSFLFETPNLINYKTKDFASLNWNDFYQCRKELFISFWYSIYALIKSTYTAICFISLWGNTDIISKWSTFSEQIAV